MDDKRLELRISADLLAAVDRARGDVKRAAWVKDAMREALGVLDGPEVRRMRELAGGVQLPSGPPPRVVSAEATFDRFYSEGLRACPECGGDPVKVDGVRYCEDCKMKL